MAKVEKEVEKLQSVILARQLASFHPTSISIQNFGEISTFDTKARYKKENKSESNLKSFIPPSPSVTVEKETSIFSVPKPVSNHRFGFLLHDIKPVEVKQTPVKMKYELPNMQHVVTPTKYGRPLMIVSLSTNDLNKKAQDAEKSEAQAKSQAKNNPEPPKNVQK